VQDEEVCQLRTVGKWLDEKPWGQSTDFNASMRIMLLLLKQKYPQGTDRRQVVIVFTDMQFDCADEGNMHVENFATVQQEFAAARLVCFLSV
jgi:Mg-chelatase subunit ChlD